MYFERLSRMLILLYLYGVNPINEYADETNCSDVFTDLVYGRPAEAGGPELRFNREGKFKIVQFTDVHFRYGDPASDIALERINEVLEVEKPDFVIFTGDVIYSAPAEEGMRTVLELVAKRKIPFGVVCGNHDDEQGMSRGELLEVIRTIPYNLTARADGISGETNFILPVKSFCGDKAALVLYCFDSHSYSSVKGVRGYDFLKPDQIAWYRDNSRKYTEANGDGRCPLWLFPHPSAGIQSGGRR